MDQLGKQLYDQGGSAIANFDARRNYPYRADGSLYEYSGGVGKKYSIRRDHWVLQAGTP
jgi:hypothetical protein